MVSSILLIAEIAALAVTVQGAFGPYFSTGPVASNSFIRESTSTLILPNTPSGSTGIMSLWVGMGTSNGDLIQSIADNDQSLSGNPQRDQWGVFAYTLKKTGPNSQAPVQTQRKIFTAGNQVTMHYTYNDSTQNYTQTVLVNGQLSATLSTSDGVAQGWGSAVECAATNCGTVPAHSWINTQIILNVADPNYSQTLGKSAGVGGSMSTPDGGKTWNIGTITIPQFTF